MSIREPSRRAAPDERTRPVDPGAAALFEKKIDSEAVAALLKQWAEEDARDPEPPGSWEEFKRAIDANRQSTRKLFP